MCDRVSGALWWLAGGLHSTVAFTERETRAVPSRQDAGTALKREEYSPETRARTVPVAPPSLSQFRSP